MKIYIVIPAYNEARYLGKTLDSLIHQTFKPAKILVVNDGSTDDTATILQEYTRAHAFIDSLTLHTDMGHEPGSKVVNAFTKGLEQLDDSYDVICKFDADLIFPEDYLERMAAIFSEDENIGMAGGFCTIKKGDSWKEEGITGTDHIRGALKAYRKACFKAIGGLKNRMGWDTIDEFLARYHGWKVVTAPTLLVKHLKPTGSTYARNARFRQGEAFYNMRYGLPLTAIAALKLALKKGNPGVFTDCLVGYFKAKHQSNPPAVSIAEGIFIRKYRWSGIRKKLIP